MLRCSSCLLVNALHNWDSLTLASWLRFGTCQHPAVSSVNQKIECTLCGILVQTPPHVRSVTLDASLSVPIIGKSGLYLHLKPTNHTIGILAMASCL